MRKLEREESMMCRNDKSRVGPKWKTQHLPPVPERHEGNHRTKITIIINMENEIEMENEK